MDESTIYLIRHGEIHNPLGQFYGRFLDLDLNQKGREQIAQLGKTIVERGNTPQVLFTSPMRRTIQTSDILSKVFGDIPIIPSEDLLEVNSSGFEGWSLQEVLDYEDIYHSPPHGVEIESINDVARRMLHAIKTATEKYSNVSIGFVSHGDPIAITRWAMENPSLPQVPNKEIFRYSPLKGEAWRLKAYPDGSFGDYNLIRGEISYPGKEQRR